MRKFILLGLVLMLALVALPTASAQTWKEWLVGIDKDDFVKLIKNTDQCFPGEVCETIYEVCGVGKTLDLEKSYFTFKTDTEVTLKRDDDFQYITTPEYQMNYSKLVPNTCYRQSCSPYSEKITPINGSEQYNGWHQNCTQSSYDCSYYAESYKPYKAD